MASSSSPENTSGEARTGRGRSPLFPLTRSRIMPTPPSQGAVLMQGSANLNVMMKARADGRARAP